MSPAITATSGTTSQNSTTSTTAASASVDKNMFLKLLVAQLRNQDPLNPSDGTQFVAQLAEFQQLEETINMSQDITAMRNDLDLILSGQSTGATTQS